MVSRKEYIIIFFSRNHCFPLRRYEISKTICFIGSAACVQKNPCSALKHRLPCTLRCLRMMKARCHKWDIFLRSDLAEEIVMIYVTESGVVSGPKLHQTEIPPKLSHLRLAELKWFSIGIYGIYIGGCRASWPSRVVPRSVTKRCGPINVPAFGFVLRDHRN